MNGRRISILGLAILFIGQLIYYYPQMPEKMASHFNSVGEPNGWMPKNGFFAFEIGLLAVFLILFFSLRYFIPRLPDNLINLPNKTYWLAPERRDATLKMVLAQIEIFHIPIFLLLILINQSVFRANLTHENLSSLPWFYLGAFVVFTIVWLFRLSRTFKVYEN